jgi:deoxyribonuclease V
MDLQYNHLSPAEAIAQQQVLRQQIDLRPLEKPITTIAGADISFNKYSPVVYAGIVVMKFPTLEVIDQSFVIDETTFPYIPGLLAFREVPALAKAWNQLAHKPDVLVLDGQGIAHPRRMGIAAHFGVVMQTPALGCAKSLLTGKFEEPGNLPGNYTSLTDKGEEIGKVLRTKRNCKPVFVSPGHLISMQQSLDIILQCVRQYRIPEPTRLVHNYVNQVRVSNMP